MKDAYGKMVKPVKVLMGLYKEGAYNRHDYFRLEVYEALMFVDNVLVPTVRKCWKYEDEEAFSEIGRVSFGSLKAAQDFAETLAAEKEDRL
jgi:hypothetical protein